MNLKERLLAFLEYKDIKKGTFEKMVGLSNGFVDKVGDNTRVKKLEQISNFFPDLNMIWLRTGEGEMLKDSPPKNESAAIVNHQVGNGNHFASNPTVDRFLDELAAQRELYTKQLTKSQEQMDRLITIIEQFKK